MDGQAEEQFLVLVADDSKDDRMLLNLAMCQAPRLRVVAEVTNGAEVIAYLQGHSHFSDRAKYPLPDLILLDLNMPVKDGFEVLTWLSKQIWPNLRVVVLTDSMNPAHIKRALDLGADHFQVKPSARGELEAMVLALEASLLQPGRSMSRTKSHSAERMA